MNPNRETKYLAQIRGQTNKRKRQKELLNTAKPDIENSENGFSNADGKKRQKYEEEMNLNQSPEKISS